VVPRPESVLRMETRRAIRMLRVAKQRRQAAGVAGRKRGAENEGAEVAPDELTLEVRAGVRDEVSSHARHEAAETADLVAPPVVEPVLEATREALVKKAAAKRAAIVKEAELRTAQIQRDLALALAQADVELAAELSKLPDKLAAPAEKQNMERSYSEHRKVHRRAQTHTGISNAPLSGRKMDLPPRSTETTGSWVITIDGSGKERLRPPKPAPKRSKTFSAPISARPDKHRTKRVGSKSSVFSHKCFSKCCGTCLMYSVYTIGGLLAMPFMIASLIVCCPCIFFSGIGICRGSDGDDETWYLSDVFTGFR
jgi:hypothetical protein